MTSDKLEHFCQLCLSLLSCLNSEALSSWSYFRQLDYKMAESCSTAAGAPDDRRRSRYPMIDVADAMVHVLQNVSPLALDDVPLMEACGRVVAADVAANDPFPAFRASTMDGYAVMGDLEPGIYDVQQRIHAGDASEKSEILKVGSIVYITTGAMVPEGANAVVKIEDTSSVTGGAGSESEAESKVEVAIRVPMGANIRQIGSDIRAGASSLTPLHHESALSLVNLGGCQSHSF